VPPLLRRHPLLQGGGSADLQEAVHHPCSDGIHAQKGRRPDLQDAACRDRKGARARRLHGQRGGARRHHRGRKGPRARYRLGQRGMHAAQGICSRARSGAPLASSASEDLVADPSELPRLRRRTSMKTQLAPVGPHESLVLRPPQVGSSLPHPLAAAHPAASCRGSSQPLHRASPSLPAGELAAAAGGTTGSGMKGKRHRG
jgi:hypothetical protein